MILGRLNEHLRGPIARGALGTLVLKASQAGLGFALNLLLARVLGAEGYGAYSFALAVTGLLVVAAALGLDTLLVREVATYKTRANWALMRGLLRRSNQMGLLTAIGLALAVAAVAWALEEWLESDMLTALWVGLLALPVLTLTRLRQAAMQGLRHVVAGQIPETIVQPLVLMSFIGIASLVLSSNITGSLAVGLNVAAVTIALLVGIVLLRRSLPIALKQAGIEFHTRAWLRSARRFLLIGGMLVIISHTDIIMLGAMKGAETAGIYSVVSRVISLISYIVFAVNAPLTPFMADRYAARAIEELQRTVTKGARVIFLLAVLIILVFVVLGDWLLALFGPEFPKGYAALLILCVGQIPFVLGGGVAGPLLAMTGHEREAAIVIGVAAILNIVLNVALIPKWGIEGAALATMVSVLVWHVSLAVLAYKMLGISVTPFRSLQRPNHHSV